MDTRKEPETTDRTVKTERTGPIPLADRRRLVRQSDNSEDTAQVFTDWASI